MLTISDFKKNVKVGTLIECKILTCSNTKREWVVKNPTPVGVVTRVNEIAFFLKREDQEYMYTFPNIGDYTVLDDGYTVEMCYNTKTHKFQVYYNILK